MFVFYLFLFCFCLIDLFFRSLDVNDVVPVVGDSVLILGALLQLLFVNVGGGKQAVNNGYNTDPRGLNCLRQLSPAMRVK